MCIKLNSYKIITLPLNIHEKTITHSFIFLETQENSLRMFNAPPDYRLYQSKSLTKSISLELRPWFTIGNFSLSVNYRLIHKARIVFLTTKHKLNHKTKELLYIRRVSPFVPWFLSNNPNILSPFLVIPTNSYYKLTFYTCMNQARHFDAWVSNTMCCSHHLHISHYGIPITSKA